MAVLGFTCTSSASGSTAAGVDSINTTASGAVTITGAGSVFVYTQSNIITISGLPSVPATGTSKALIGTDGITVVSGISTITLTGFRSEFVSASGSLQSQISAIGTPSNKAIVSNSSNLTVTSGSSTISLAPSSTPTYTSVIATTLSGTTITGTTGQFSGSLSTQNLSVSNSITVSGSPVLTQVKLPFHRVAVGDSSGNLSYDTGLSWYHTGSFQDALQATHIALTLTGTSSDPVIHGGDTTGRSSGLYYQNYLGVLPIFTWSIQGIDATRLMGSFIGARQLVEIGVGLFPCNLNMFGRLTGIGNSVITLHKNTTSQRDALPAPNDNPSDGSIHFNTTVSGFQGYRSGSWRDFVLSSGTGANIPTFTPSSSADTAGAVGDLAMDSTYLYGKRSAGGWGRIAWNNF
jgi:hypothetical protein